MKTGSLSGSFTVRERRRAPRVRVGSTLGVVLRRPGPPVPVRDVSLVGFAVESAGPVQPGTLHQCELMPVTGPSEILLAQAVRSDRVPGTSHFVTGFQFSTIEPDSRLRISRLIDVVTGAGHHGL